MCRFKLAKRIGPVVLVLIAFAFAACSSKESKESETTTAQKPQTQSQPSTYARTVQKARANVAALSNPKVATDPVCGMAIDENAIIVTIDGKDYGVCSEKCAEKLRKNPELYLASADTGNN